MTIENTTMRRRIENISCPPLSEKIDHPIDIGLNTLLADMFALYLKTKNFHWHVTGAHFREYHLLLDEQATEILQGTDDAAERVRKLGGITVRSIGHVSRLQRVRDNDELCLAAREMLAELRQDNMQMAIHLLELREVCEAFGDVATVSLIDGWIDEAQGRAWVLTESLLQSA